MHQPFLTKPRTTAIPCPVGAGDGVFVKKPDDRRDPQTFIIALEKVEAWMFSRIIESVWWQTLTPHMQSTATNASGKTVGQSQTSKKTSGSKNGLGNQQDAMGFNSSTRIYLAAGELFGGERFMKPFRSMFQLLENHSTVDSSNELKEITPRVYLVRLLITWFVFYQTFLCRHMTDQALRPDRNALAPIFIEREKGHTC